MDWRESFSPDLFSLPVLFNTVLMCCCICILECQLLNLSLSLRINLLYENRHRESTEKQGIVLKTSVLMSQRTTQWENICSEGILHQFLFILTKHVFSLYFFPERSSTLLSWKLLRCRNEAQMIALTFCICISHTMFWFKVLK